MIAYFASAAIAFDLICSGTHVTGKIDRSAHRLSERSETSSTWIYRISFADNRWCSDACEETKDIALVTHNMIYLDRWERSNAGIEFFTYVSRETGEVVDQRNSGDHVNVRRGTCERGRFSGFPARKF